MKFIADEMLGKLARWLRFMGFDVAYFKSIPDHELLKIVQEEDRFLLTRDTKLIRKLSNVDFLFITEDHLEDQLTQFFVRFPEAFTQQQTLSRCVECNALLQKMDKKQAEGKVWPYVYQTQEHFTFCSSCDRIYWKATHVRKILEKIERLIKKEEKK